VNALFVLIPVTVLLVGVALWAFFWAIDAGQFDDLDTPPLEILQSDQVAVASDRAEDSAA
jgi:cbb3-type cytochrome oxidase maturation protein